MGIARRTMIMAAAALTLAACNNAGGSGAGAGVNEDMSLGPKDAKVTLIEYASPTCPHCAAWNEEVFPVLKSRYIDTGKVRYVLREAPIHGAPDVAVFMLGRCAGQDKYFQVVDAAMRSLEEVQASGDLRGWVVRIGQSMGMNQQQIDTCLNDAKSMEALTKRAQKGMDEHQVRSTPTFILNGRKLDTAPSAADLPGLIDPLLK